MTVARVKHVIPAVDYFAFTVRVVVVGRPLVPEAAVLGAVSRRLLLSCVEVLDPWNGPDAPARYDCDSTAHHGETVPTNLSALSVG
jgi:hypothetical protein